MGLLLLIGGFYFIKISASGHREIHSSAGVFKNIVQKKTKMRRKKGVFLCRKPMIYNMASYIIEIT